jgi:ATP-dependent exoDNAse (exonuclease V) beta subunit
VAAASEEGHRELEQERETGQRDLTPPRGLGSEADRQVATSVGTAIHHLLESLDLERSLETQIEDRRDGLIEDLVSRLGEGSRPALADRVDEILTSILGGRCLNRMQEVAQLVVARELPLLLPATRSEDPGAEGPLEMISGTADMVFRDPVGDELVIVDYKTDRVRGEASVLARARLYAAQARAYADALTGALGLERSARAELWFLLDDRVVPVEGDLDGGIAPDLRD